MLHPGLVEQECSQQDDAHTQRNQSALIGPTDLRDQRQGVDQRDETACHQDSTWKIKVSFADIFSL